MTQSVMWGVVERMGHYPVRKGWPVKDTSFDRSTDRAVIETDNQQKKGNPL